MIKLIITYNLIFCISHVILHVCVNVASLLLHVDSDDAGALLGESVQVGPVREVAPGGQREVDVVAEGDLCWH